MHLSICFWAVPCTTWLFLLWSVRNTHPPPIKMNPSTSLGPKLVASFQTLINNTPKQRSSSSPSKCSSWAHHLWKTPRYSQVPVFSSWLSHLRPVKSQAILPPILDPSSHSLPTLIYSWLPYCCLKSSLTNCNSLLTSSLTLEFSLQSLKCLKVT